MQVSHLNTFLNGGAAVAARRLHEELLKSGVDSCFYYSRQEGIHEELGPTYRPAEWRKTRWPHRLGSALQFRGQRWSFKRAMRDRPLGHEIFSSPRGAARSHWPVVSGPSRDIVHLHWISKLIDYNSLFESLPAEQPLVWTLHDMNALTGGCHFSAGCHRFQVGCGNCPQLKDGGADDLSRSFFAQKRAALGGRNLHVVAPSRWLLDAAKSSPMFETARSFTRIPYGVSSNDYYPMDRIEARARLGIQPDATVVAFGSIDTQTQRHGAAHLIGALEQLVDLHDLQAIVFGPGSLPQTSKPIPIVREVGPLLGLLHQRTIFSASDVLVLPSLQENLPLAGLQAMACGTPVVAFDVGGIPDFVRPNRTGLLARAGDTADLGRALRKLAQWPALTRWLGENARRMMETEFTPQREASSYQQLYETLTGDASLSRRRAA